MRKYEPKNSQMSMESGQFVGKEKGTFVGKILVESLSAKAKFGQNLESAEWEQIMQDLKNRKEKRDAETIELMQRFVTK